MTLLEQQLRASIALPKLIEAVQKIIPRLEAEHKNCSADTAWAVFNDRHKYRIDELKAREDECLQLLFLCRAALETAVPPVEVEVFELYRSASERVNYETRNLKMMQMLGGGQ